MKFIVEPNHSENSILSNNCPTLIAGCKPFNPGCHPNACIGPGLCFTYCSKECYYHNCTSANSTTPSGINNSKKAFK